MTKLGLAAFGMMLACGTASVSLAQSGSAPSQPRSKSEWMTRRDGGHGARRLLDGLSLSANEKAGVASVQEGYESQFKTLREQMKPAMDEARAARQRGDTAAVRAAFAKTAGAREQMRTLREQEMTQLRSKLTPEHQRAFDAKVASFKAKRGKGEHKQHGRRGTGA